MDTNSEITIQYRIKEDELEYETARLYSKAMNSLQHITELDLSDDLTVLSHKTLDNIVNYKAKLVDSIGLLTNVENIVIQYLDYRSSATTPRQTVADLVPATKEQDTPITTAETRESQSTYDYQRKLAKELGKDEISTKRAD
jgi:hypothetical protein